MQKNEQEKYWNPLLETLSPKRLKIFNLKNLSALLNGYQNSKLYRCLYDDAGFKPEDLQRWEDISKARIVQKEDYRKAQAKEPWPYGDSLASRWMT